jgi:hypothetical protein
MTKIFKKNKLPMKKTLIILSLCIMAITTSYAQNAPPTLNGKTYEGLISEEQIDGVREIVSEDGTVAVEGIGGRVSVYFILTFEKDSVLISEQVKKTGSIFENEENENLSEFGKYPYKLVNQTIKISKFRMFDFQQEQTFTLRIENESQTLIVEQKTNPFLMREVSFQRICTDKK